MNITKAERERLAEMVKDIFPSYLPGRFDDDIESIRSLILNPPSDAKPSVTMGELNKATDYNVAEEDMDALVDLLRSRGVGVKE